MSRSGPKPVAVVRIRGRVGVRYDMEDTLRFLNLKRKFWATVVPSTPAYMGMLFKVKDLIIYGEVDLGTIKLLLERRGCTKFGDRVTDEWLTKNTEFKSVEDLASKIYSCEVKLSRLDWIKPYFRLSPPKGGFKRSTKRSFSSGGELGFRGSEINTLLRRMI